MDHVAGTPVDPRVFETMKKYFLENYGNPFSVHSFGLNSRNAIREAREKVAQLIGAKKVEEVVFTSGGTESNNCKHLQKKGFEITYIPVNKEGLVNPKKIEETINDRTILISVSYANSEIGTIQPIREIGKITREKQIYLHVDAVAATGKMPVNVIEENIDLLTISSNDIYGPKGVGALYIKRGTKIQPVVQGGGQERGIRSGTENVPGIVGIGRAAEIAQKEMFIEGKRLSQLRDKLIKGVLNKIDHSYLNGHPTRRIPNNANLRFSYIEGEALILGLDMYGIKVSSGSACTSKTLEASHVLRAIGLTHEEAHGSLVFTMGKQNSDEDVEYILEVLPSVVKRLRMMSPLTPKELLR
jgi:cysteine desulfurase